MSILAEPRRKRKICLDPQNLAWKNDTNKFGHKMLQNMGWNDGQGLGRNNQGMTENIKLKANYTQKGIGAEASDADRTWIAHHDEFSFLLEKLNAKKAAKVTEKEKEEESKDSEEESDEEKEATKSKKLRNDGSKSLEEKSKATKTRIHYKYTKMKDLTRYSEKDKSAVIGVGLKSKIVEEEPKEKAPAEKTFEEPATVKNSAVSVTDYFAAKMAKFYAKKNGTELTTPEIKEEEKVEIVEKVVVAGDEAEEEERLRRKAEKKALKKAKREAEAAAVETNNFEDDEEIYLREKAERKEKRRKERREALALVEEAE